jgi:hypothetical protein
MGPEPVPVAPTPVSAAPVEKTVVETKVDPKLEKKLKIQADALDDISAASDRAAKNNRLRAEIARILQKLKDQQASGQ